MVVRAQSVPANQCPPRPPARRHHGRHFAWPSQHAACCQPGDRTMPLIGCVTASHRFHPSLCGSLHPSRSTTHRRTTPQHHTAAAAAAQQLDFASRSSQLTSPPLCLSPLPLPSFLPNIALKRDRRPDKGSWAQPGHAIRRRQRAVSMICVTRHALPTAAVDKLE